MVFAIHIQMSWNFLGERYTGGSYEKVIEGGEEKEGTLLSF